MRPVDITILLVVFFVGLYLIVRSVSQMKDKDISWRLIMSRSSFVMISLILFVAGLILIFGSVRWGNNATSAFIASHGGSIDTSVFTIILQEYISVYRWAGSILSIIGGLGFVKIIEIK
jgi:uncharacterized membrane protein